MKIERRIQALEARMTSAPVILYFTDGGAQALRGPRFFMARLFMAVLERNATPYQGEELALIRQSVGSQERSGGHMVDLVRLTLAAMENGPPVGQSELDRCEGLTNDECFQASPQGRTATHGSQ